MLVYILVRIILCPLMVRNNLVQKAIVGCFALIVFLCFVTVNGWCIFLYIPWVCLQCVIVIFPDHTQLLFCPSIKIN